MKVTRLGPPIPILNSGLGGNAGSRIPAGGNDLQVLTSNGSNGRYWGENVRRITSNGSNILLSPDVNIASGTGVTLSIASNTLTIASTASGGALTVADEGTPLSGSATTLDFTGAGVTASGAGGTKTINIPGGSGGGGGRGEYASKYNPDHETPATTPADAEEFNTTKGMAWDSAPATDDLAAMPGFLLFAGSTAERHLSKAWTPGSTDITIACRFSYAMGTTVAGGIGLYVGDTTGNPANAVYAIFEPDNAATLGSFDLYNENASSFALVVATTMTRADKVRQQVYMRLTRVNSGPTWTAYISFDGRTWFPLATTGSKSLTIGAYGIRTDCNHTIALDWIRVWTSVVAQVGA